MDEKIDKWVEEEEAKEKEQRKQRFEEKGYKEFAKLGIGETTLTVLPVLPRQQEGNFGLQNIYRVKIGKDEYDLGTKTGSPLNKILRNALKEAPKKIVVVKAGEGKSTRWSQK